MNNYNVSDTGYNVEMSVFYDTDLSQIYFDENFEIDNRGQSLIYTGGENFEPIITVNDTPENRAKLLDAARWDEDDGAEWETCDDLAGEIFYDYKTVDEKLTEYTRAGIDYTANFSVMISTGYSQGDRRAVYIPLDAGGYVTRDYIDHLLWDCPITARVEISGEWEGEYFEEAFMPEGDFYAWDADAARENIRRLMDRDGAPDAAIKEVMGIIPEALHYV